MMHSVTFSVFVCFSVEPSLVGESLEVLQSLQAAMARNADSDEDDLDEAALIPVQTQIVGHHLAAISGQEDDKAARVVCCKVCERLSDEECCFHLNCT